MKCDVCGNAGFHDEHVDEVFCIDGHMVMVENIPARVCDRCGDATFACETVEQVRRTVQGGGTPTRHVSLDVFALA